MEGSSPGTGHEKHTRGRRKARDLQADYRDSVVSNEGKSGQYRRRQFKGSATLGKEGARSGKASFDLEVDDEILNERIPNRYRETVRTYFKLLPELFVD